MATYKLTIRTSLQHLNNSLFYFASLSRIANISITSKRENTTNNGGAASNNRVYV